nr:ATP-grasp domain-containing protein [Haemophilus parainfluenzae]
MTENNQRDITTIYSVKLSQKNLFLLIMKFSIVGARFKNGEKRFYPVTHNLQQNGILRYSVTDISFLNNKSQQIQAESMLGKIMDKLEYVGVMAMECWVGINY